MTPFICQTLHNPPISYGDCVRACVASLLDIEPPLVPHFFDAGQDGVEGVASMREYLKSQGLGVAFFAIDGSMSREDVGEFMKANNPNMYYILYGQLQSGGAHAVIGLNDNIVHNPHWLSEKLVGPMDANNAWVVAIITSAKIIAE